MVKPAKIFIIILLFPLIVIFLSIPCFGADHYIDCSAPTNGIGTQGSPWNAIFNITGMSNGDDLYFKRGTTCSGSININWSGTGASNYSIIGVYGIGERPIIDGTGNSNSVELNSNNYITIEHLNIKNSTDSNVRIRKIGRAHV